MMKKILLLVLVTLFINVQPAEQKSNALGKQFEIEAKDIVRQVKLASIKEKKLKLINGDYNNRLKECSSGILKSLKIEPSNRYIQELTELMRLYLSNEIFLREYEISQLRPPIDAINERDNVELSMTHYLTKLAFFHLKEQIALIVLDALNKLTETIL